MSNKPPKIVIPGLNRGAGVPGGFVVGRRRATKQGPAELLDLNQLLGQGLATKAHANQGTSTAASTAHSETVSLSTSVSTAVSSVVSTNVTQSTSLSQISSSLSGTISTNVGQSTSLSQISSSLSGAISSTASLSTAVSTVDSGQTASLSQISSSLSGAISSTSSLSSAVSTVISGSISTVNSRIDSLSTAGGGGGATTFLALTDTPATYAGAALKYTRVNAGETALEFNALSTGGFETLDVDYTDAGNVTTAETDLFTYTIAAGKLAANGDRVETQWSGAFVSSGTATRQMRAYFGGTMIFDSGALTVSLAAAWDVYCTITRVSATVIRYAVSMTTEGAALAAYTASGEVTGLTLSNTNIVKITGTAAGVGAATNDIVGKMGNVSFYPLSGGAINDIAPYSTSLSQISSSLSGAISSTTSLSTAVSTAISGSISTVNSSITSLSTAISTVDSNQSSSISVNLSKINSLSTAVGSGSDPDGNAARTKPVIASFTLENPGAGATLAVMTDGTNGILLTAPTSGVNARFMRLTAGLPGASWTLTIRARTVAPHNNVVHTCCIMLRNNTSGRLMTLGNGSNTNIIVERWTSYTAASAASFSYGAYHAELPWRRITSDGTTLSFSCSPDGQSDTWALIGTEAIATFLTATGGSLDQVGIGLFFGAASTVTQVNLFQSFTLV